MMSNYGISAVEAVGMTIPENLSNDPVTKAVYDNILGNIPLKKKVTVYCKVCSLEFSSQVVLDTHLAGSKHQRKLQSKELMKNLEETESGFERNNVSGVIRCTICDVTVNSPQLLAAHVAGNKHKSKKGKRENGEEGGTPAKKLCPEQSNGMKAKSGSGANMPPKKKERVALDINIPSCVTKLEDTKAGGKFLCNPCQAHCNSDVQLSQHLSSKKHIEKLKTDEQLKDLEESDPNVSRVPDTGDLTCTLCKTTCKSPGAMLKHLGSRTHRANLGEDVSAMDEDKPAQSNGTSKPKTPKTSKSAKSASKKAPISSTMEIPACVTKLEETSSGGRFLCNLCQAHCNSDIQLEQHLKCKKHIEKVAADNQVGDDESKENKTS